MSARHPPLEFLRDQDLVRIEETAFRLLDEVGISLQHAEATEMLAGRGCREIQGRVHIPREAVEWALANVKQHHLLPTVRGTGGLALGDGQIRFHNGGGPPFVYDLEDGRRRPALLRDVAHMTRLLDALPNVDVVIPLFGAQDVPPELMELAGTAEMLRNTRKPVCSGGVDKAEQVPYVVEMAAACCGGTEAFRARPTMAISVSPVSPMTFTGSVAGAIVAVARSGAPFHSLPCPSLGATGPITMAGCLAQQHAEVLASFLIAASARPGVQVLYCSRISPIDLRTAVSSWGGPEVGLAGACAGQLAHRLELACNSYGLAGGVGLLDPQFAYQRLANALVPALAGVDLLSGVGNTESGLAGGYEVAVIDDEIIGLLKRIARGCEVTEETLAYEVMREAITRDGVFLAEQHTVRQMRRGALWVPGISATPSSGEERHGVVAGARARAQEILRTHEVEPLPEDVEKHLGEILERARRELVRG
ncbi:MAG TPA: trimethylamine methyltransferase family protein [Anaerolineae bacterium]|nr:trimethylamine methyltransferase family protein [Anaerolineae bacterium]